MNVAIFLDEVNEFNGPLMFIPGSHKQGVLDAQHDTSTTSYPLWTITNDAIRTMVGKGGIVAPKGPAGSMILFHGCLVHASTSNLSPWNRVAVYLSLCAVNCLLKDYDVALPWKNGTPASALQTSLEVLKEAA